MHAIIAALLELTAARRVFTAKCTTHLALRSRDVTAHFIGPLASSCALAVAARAPHLALVHPRRPHHHGELGDVLHGLLVRLRVRRHEHRRDSTLWVGAFALVNGGISTALMALAALATGAPLVFPSLGPTAFMLFYQPTSPAACPRNALLGHLIGILAGYLSLVAFGLQHAAPALTGGLTLGWAGSASLSLALTAGFMVWLRVPHPPAGATTLIVSLGILPRPLELLAMFAAIVALVVQGFVINRVASVPYPIWAPPRPAKPAPGP